MAQSARDESVVWTKEALLQEVNRQLKEDNPSTKRKDITYENLITETHDQPN